MGESAAGEVHQPTAGLLFCVGWGQASAAKLTSPSLPFSLPAPLHHHPRGFPGLPSLEQGKGPPHLGPWPSSGSSQPFYKGGVFCPQKGPRRIESASNPDCCVTLNLTGLQASVPRLTCKSASQRVMCCIHTGASVNGRKIGVGGGVIDSSLVTGLGGRGDRGN